MTVRRAARSVVRRAYALERRLGLGGLPARIIRGALLTAGVYERWRANASELRLVRVTLPVPSLPRCMEGYRILHLSDLHLDGVSPRARRLTALLRDVEADVALLTGDYLSRGHPYDPQAIEQLHAVLRSVRPAHGVYAVAGNHDTPAVMRLLRGHGVCVLDNRSVLVSGPGSRYRLVGLRSAHGRGVPDVASAFAGGRPGEFTVVIVHKPDYASVVARRGAGVYLCGHTHAGQVHLPLVGPLLHNTTAPRRLSAGSWEVDGMVGYTSPGVGTSFVDVRFGCRPEATVITLRRGG